MLYGILPGFILAIFLVAGEDRGFISAGMSFSAK